jgi:hypothetical protein
LTEAAQI